MAPPVTSVRGAGTSACGAAGSSAGDDPPNSSTPDSPAADDGADRRARRPGVRAVGTACAPVPVTAVSPAAAWEPLPVAPPPGAHGPGSAVSAQVIRPASAVVAPVGESAVTAAPVSSGVSGSVSSYPASRTRWRPEALTRSSSRVAAGTADRAASSAGAEDTACLPRGDGTEGELCSAASRAIRSRGST
ncbi:hypothetical protein [Pseudonocardia sp. ICBG162]|uniref:hypothetical protein n=1 Tax=Pseudonocardia sp. ICBG162 TaxID=2846761 RepID=UPI001CF63066